VIPFWPFKRRPVHPTLAPLDLFIIKEVMTSLATLQAAVVANTAAVAAAVSRIGAPPVVTGTPDADLDAITTQVDANTAANNAALSPAAAAAAAEPAADPAPAANVPA
jgi:hypothetical protein